MQDTEREHDHTPGHLIESRNAGIPRVATFYVIVAAFLLFLAGGLAYQQLFKSNQFRESERLQTQRRVLIPGPRGNIYDRYGRLLVGNRPRWAVVLYLDELQPDFRRESIRIRNNYRATGDRDIPSWSEMERIAHVSVTQRYLDQVNAITGRHERIDGGALSRHFARQLYMPYPLVDDLTPQEFARLLEELSVSSPLQLYTSNERFYPFGSAAAHALGYVGTDESPEADDFPGEDLKTFPMPGTIGRDGLEKKFDSELQGQAGGSIFRVDPAGYKVNPPLDHRLPIQGKNLSTSLDIDLQLAAEDAIGDQTGAAVVLDVGTGEVMVMASKPDYNLNDFSPRLSHEAADNIQKKGAWLNLAIAGFYPPGSTFKTVVTTAGLLNHTLNPDDTTVDCEGTLRVGNRTFSCDNGLGHHGRLDLRGAIAISCDVYFWAHGLMIGPDAIAEQARRFHLDVPTGIELPGEAKHMLIPDPAWKQRQRHEAWTAGDTANMSIGQGFVTVTPMVMACFAASLARNETTTRPTLLHDPHHPRQQTEPIGFTPAQRQALVDGMEAVTHKGGTAPILTELPAMRIPGVRIAGKTGTAQYGDHLNVAWFICFAPIENPEIAMAVAVRSDKPGEGYSGGINGASVADAILKRYFEKRNRPATPAIASNP